VLQAIAACRSFPPDLSPFRTIDHGQPAADIALILKWTDPPGDFETRIQYRERQGPMCFHNGQPSKNEPHLDGLVRNFASQMRVFTLSADRDREPVALVPAIELHRDGYGLAGVLDRLRDQHPERFEALNRELAAWLPGFDRITFDVPEQGKRSLSLRRRGDQSILPASMLSDGTMLSLCVLTLAYLAQPPILIGIEEPEHGLHPWLMRRVQDAIYRLCYPEQHGEQRQPVQVVATTHSPYFLDLFKDHPEEVVVATKDQSGVKFGRLGDFQEIGAILHDAPLGEVWYSGAIGGVPVEP
jgi:predicted ATPase